MLQPIKFYVFSMDIKLDLPQKGKKIEGVSVESAENI
jgi:hypothetical protein